MNKLLLILALLFLALQQVKAQGQDNTLLIEEYLRQSEKQKKTGITMLAVGGGAVVVGVLIAVTADGWDGVGSGVIFSSVGIATALIGVPIIISSASKARKAAQLSLGANSARVINPNGSSITIYPALNLSIPLNSQNR